MVEKSHTAGLNRLITCSDTTGIDEKKPALGGLSYAENLLQTKGESCVRFIAAGCSSERFAQIDHEHRSDNSSQRQGYFLGFFSRGEGRKVLGCGSHGIAPNVGLLYEHKIGQYGPQFQFQCLIEDIRTVNDISYLNVTASQLDTHDGLRSLAELATSGATVMPSFSLGHPTRPRTSRAQVIAKHRAGTTISELARQYGVSRLSISRIAKPEVAQV